MVLSHGPPYLHRDLTIGRRNAGSPVLLRRLEQVKPRLTVCGHIHEGFGVEAADWGGEIYNVSLDDAGRTVPVRLPSY